MYIRKAELGDAALIADISRQTFYDSFAGDNTVENMDKFMNGPFARERLMAEVPDPANYFFIAELAGQTMGYLKMRESGNSKDLQRTDAIEIARIYAVKDAIGRGVGKTLMQAAMDHALLLKKQIIWLGVWEKNQRAIDFYKKWGFTKFGEHVFIVGDDPQTDWLLMKELG
jgi:ribosomal protein S18 acetylase RimI-like enzyme